MEDKFFEISDEMLREVIGGGDGAPGFTCPQCKRPVPVSVDKLASGGMIVCPGCGLCLGIEKSKSAKAVEALKKVEAAQKKERKLTNG